MSKIIFWLGLFVVLSMNGVMFAATENIYVAKTVLAQSNPSLLITSNRQQIVPKLKRYGKYIGDKIEYSFKLADLLALPSFNISFTDPSGNEDIVIVTQSLTSSKKKEILYRLEVIPFTVGVVRFPTFNIMQYEVKSMRVTVNSVLKEGITANFVANYKPYQDYSDIILLFVFIVLASGSYFVYQKYQRYQKEQEKIITPEKKLEMWQILMEVFQERVANDSIRKYYFVSSEKLKEFVTRILSLEIMELTTYEIMGVLQNSSLTDKELLVDILRDSDSVKFAKHFPSSDELLKYQQNGIAFLNNHNPEQEGDL